MTPDTKSLIFDTALRLFAAEGYDNVTMRQIAGAVGIKAGSMYHHFKSKEQILMACYHFYAEHRHDTRLPKEYYEPILRHGTKEAVLQVLNYAYHDDILDKMISCLLIMFSRMYIDEQAKALYADEINASMNYLKEFFTTGIAIGRFHAFNHASISLLYLSFRLFVAQSTTLKPEHKATWRKAEVEMLDELLRSIPFAY